MSKFIAVTFLMLGVGFYELSGGADFEPAERPIKQTVISTKSIDIAPIAEPVVTRAAAPVAPIAAEVEPTPPPTPVVLDVAPIAVEPEVRLDLREVAGGRVNMRSGPSTNNAILDTLVRGTETEVLEVNADGWARVRVISTDQIGWMAERFLSNS